jgi:hypothetical protein
MPNASNKSPPRKGFPNEEEFLKQSKASTLDFLKQCREGFTDTQAHATSPDAVATQGVEVTPPPNEPIPEPQEPKLSGGGTPPTVPPKQPPSGGGGDDEGEKGNPWLAFLKNFVRDPLFLAGLIFIPFLFIGWQQIKAINRDMNSPEVMEREAVNREGMKEMAKIQKDMRESNPLLNIFSATAPAVAGSVESGCVITAKDRTNNNFRNISNCSRIKYEQMQNDPGMYFDFGRGQRISSIEGRYKLLNGRTVLCQTQNPSEEKFSTDGCASALADKSLTSVGLGPLDQAGIIVTFITK